MAVILISSDLAEVLHMSHRILIYRDGAVVQEGAAASFAPEQVMEQLTGSG
jgi:ABC-type sugar transport system ATPase subunit